MNIYLNNFYNYIAPIFGHQVFSHQVISEQHKKIGIIAVAAFALITAAYLIHRCYSLRQSEVKVLDIDEQSMDDKIDEQDIDDKEDSSTKKNLYPKGNLLEGKLIDGKLEGKGHIIYLDGRNARGLFRNDMLEFGTIIYPDNTIMRGTFKDEKLEGQGQITYKDGTIEKGFFKNDFLQEGVIIAPEDGRTLSERTNAFKKEDPTSAW